VGTLVLLALVALVQFPGLKAGALSFDDSEYLTGNPLVRNPGMSSAWRFLSEVLEPSTVHGYYQPLTMISLMLDGARGGGPDHLAPFHQTSLILHLANTLLVAVVLYQLFGDVLAAGLTALLFGVHPLTVEALVWIGERKTVLAAFFALLSVASHLRHVNGGRRRFQVASVACFTLALLAKPTVTPLPLCLLLLDVWPLRRLSRRAVLEKLPFLAIALVSAVVTVESQRRTAVAVMPGRHSMSLAYVVCHNIVFYLWKMAWPAGMSANYAFPSPTNLSHPRIAAGVIGTAILLPLLAISTRWTLAPAIGWLFFFVAIFPTLGVIGFTNVIASDKYAYWPMLGMLMVLAGGIHRLRTGDGTRPAGPRTVGIVVVVLVAATGLSAATRSTLKHWESTESLFRYMVAEDGNAAAPLIYLGIELNRQQRSPEALPYLLKAAEVAPAYEGCHYNLGIVLQRTGNLDGAIAAYQQAIRLKPDFADAYNNLGNALLARGRPADAVAAYRRALDLAPALADTRYNLANVLASGRPEEAVQEYRRVINLQPRHAAARKNLAGVLLALGQPEAAREEYEQALALEPRYWDVAVYLAGVYAAGPDMAQRRPERAVELAEQAVRTTGGREASALVALAVACGEAGRSEAAAAAARAAMNLARQSGNAASVARVEGQVGRFLVAPSQNTPGR
jgi:tetratricopeptide (TPR) repeat protein